MDAAGLGAAGRHAIAQSINSLFDFTRHGMLRIGISSPTSSAPTPEIVAYLNAAFYEGRLVAAQDSAAPAGRTATVPVSTGTMCAGGLDARTAATSTMTRRMRS